MVRDSENLQSIGRAAFPRIGTLASVVIMVTTGPPSFVGS
jgi:hypothetical protein